MTNLIKPILFAILWFAPCLAFAQPIAQNHDIAIIARTDGNIIVGNGTRFVAESGATARTSLGFTNPILDYTAIANNVIFQDNVNLYLGTDSDYSIKWDGSDAVHTVTSGDFVFSGGNVGIGTPSPLQKLDIQDSDTVRINLQSTAGATNFLSNFAVGQNTVYSFYENSVHKWTMVAYPTTFQFLLNDYSQMLTFDSSGNTKIPVDNRKLFFGAADDASIYYDGSDMYFNSQEVGSGDFVFSGGNVGIGVTDPDAKLEVSGNIHLTTDSDKLLFGAAQDASIYYDGDNLLINPREAGSGSIKTIGGVFYNETSAGTINGRLVSETSGSNRRLRLYDSGGVEDVRIDTGGDSWFSGGNVGIGVTAPGAKLEVDGNLRLTSDSNELQLGAGQDYNIKWDGSDAVHTVTSGRFDFNSGDLVVNPSGTLNEGFFASQSNRGIVISSWVPQVLLQQNNGAVGYKNALVRYYDGAFVLHQLNDAGDGVDCTMMKVAGDGSYFALPNDNQPLVLGAGDDYNIKWDGSDAVHTVSSGDFVFSGGRVVVGDAESISSINSELVVAKDSQNAGIEAVGSAGGFPFFEMSRCRGTLESPAIIVNGDTAGALLAGGHDGEQLRVTGGINFVADGVVSAGNVPMRIEFETGTAISRTARMRIQSNGDINIAEALSIGKAAGTTPLAALDVASDTPTNFERVLKLGTGSTTLNSGSYIEFPSSVTDGYGAQIGGIRSGAGDNALVFLTGGNSQSERMRVDNSGNVGIGTASPGEKLVIGEDNAKLAFGAGEDASIYYDGTGLVINPAEVGTGSLSILGNANHAVDIYQGADSRGLGIYGYDDMSTKSVHFYVNPAGDTVAAISDSMTYLAGGHCTFETGAGEHVHFRLGGNFYIRDVDDSNAVRIEMRSDNGNIEMVMDNAKLLLGAGNDASIYYDGSDMVFNSQEVGSGDFVFSGGDVILPNDNQSLVQGAGDDYSQYFDGSFERFSGCSVEIDYGNAYMSKTSAGYDNYMMRLGSGSHIDEWQAAGLGHAFIDFNSNRLVTISDDGATGSLYVSGSVGIGETDSDYTADINGTLGITPGNSVDPVDNGDVVFELTNDTTLTIKAKGSDGTVRSGTLTLAP